MSIPPFDATLGRGDLPARAATATSTGLVFWEPRHGVQWMNAAAQSSLGLAAPDRLRTSAELFAGFIDAAGGAPYDVVAHVLRTGQPSPAVGIGRRRPDGHEVRLEISATPVPGPDGHPAGVVVTLVDSTGAAKDERERIERHRVLEGTIAAMHVGVVVQARSGAIVQCNPAAERILGLTADQMAGRTSMDPRWQATHEDGSPFPGDQHPAMVALATGQPQRDVIMSVHRPDGSRTLITINAEPILDGSETPAAVVATFVDITATREAEQRTQALLAQFGDLFDNAPCGYHAIGPDGTFAEINDTELAWLGVTREEVIGKRRLIDFMTPDDVALLAGTFPRLVSGELSGFEVEVDLVGRHGQRRRVLARGTVQRDATGRFTRTRTILVDLTALRHAQNQLADAQRLESLGRLTGGVAHAINNMLTTIVGSAELALESVPPGGPTHGDIEAIIEAARRGADLVGHLVTYARQQITAPVDVGLADAVDGLVRTVFATPPPGVLVTVDHQAPAVVRIDPRALDQALASLVQNAFEATAGAGAIVIATGRRDVEASGSSTTLPLAPGAYGFVTVRDTGRGMTPETLARATEPFFTTKAFGRNAGLGLSMTHGVAAQAGGGLVLTSEIDRGTTVTLFVPLSDARAGGPAD